MTGPRTTVITVGYNSSSVIGQMLASLPDDTPVVVVDNASSDNTVAVARTARPAAKVFENLENCGFGRACNQGAAGATTPYLLFLNPDATLAAGALGALEEAGNTLPDFAAANPLILDSRGRGRLKTTSPLRLHRSAPPPKLDTLSEMPVLSGGAFFVNRKAFEAVGGFDPNIFLYHEDHDLAVRLVRAGGRLWHVPKAVATHIAGTGTARSPQSARFKGFHMARSRMYVLSKQTQRFAFLRTLGPAIFGLILPHNLFSRRRRAKYIGQIQGARSARRDKGRYLSA